MDRPAFFVTAVCYQRAPIFRDPRYAELLLLILKHYRKQRRFLLHAFVLMPDHIHLILTPAADISLEKLMQLLKGGFSFRVGQELSKRKVLWQRSFTHERILTADSFRGFLRYTHQNPVEKRLCARAEDWPYSSANPRFHTDPVPEALRG